VLLIDKDLNGKKYFFLLDAIAGIFIRDIVEDSVCARDGRLKIGDQIIEVNDQSLNGFSNVQALYLLQNTSSSVRLKVRRYLDGIKYDKIKEMIGKLKFSKNEIYIVYFLSSSIITTSRRKIRISTSINYQ